MVRSPDGNGTWQVQALAALEEAVAFIQPADEVVLGLPISAILAQRLRLPTVEGEDFGEMVRIQVEKSLPYAPEEVTSDFDVIEKTDDESIVSAVSVHHASLNELAAPLLSRGVIPSRVTVYAAQRAATRAHEGPALLIHPEGDAVVSVITENGKLSFTRIFPTSEPTQIEADLPQLALGAEMQGISTTFPSILLDENCLALRSAVEETFARRTQLVGVETPPAPTALNLLPPSWQRQRQQVARRALWQKRLLLAGAVYLALVLLGLLYLGVLKFLLGSLEGRIAKDAPKVEFVQETSAKWDALAPALEPRFYPIEILLHLSQSLPSPEVHITSYTQSARQISVEGEAKSAALAYQFAENVKKKPELRKFQFDMGTPRILPGGERAQFRLEGKPK